MYVKEDIILPHTISFYDLIVNKAMGKSGPLFQARAAGVDSWPTRHGYCCAIPSAFHWAAPV